jgi:hypothetical protein
MENLNVAKPCLRVSLTLIPKGGTCGQCTWTWKLPKEISRLQGLYFFLNVYDLRD